MYIIAAEALVSKANLAIHSSRRYTCGNQGPKSAFEEMKVVNSAEVFHLSQMFQEDKNEKKVNLGVGAYRTEENEPFVLPVVKKCELEIVNNPKMNHEYLPMSGNPDFIKEATKLLLGKDCKALKEKRVVGIQSVSGTNGVRLAGEFLCQVLKRRTCFLPNPTWENHGAIFKQSGFKQIKQYPYWNAKRFKIDMSKLLSTLSSAPEGAVVLLHGSAHNPTGLDPSKKQWKQIAEVVKQAKLFPFFDSAYQGFATGNPDRDAWAIRHFVNSGFEAMIAQSFSKNMGLYNERIGNVVTVLKDKKTVPAVASQFTRLVRINYSNPPAFGSRIVAQVLSNPEYRNQWMINIKEMTDRVKQMRKELSEKLVELKTPGRWDHIVKQCGMFSYLGISEKQVQKLIKEKHIYMLKSGRINICGLNTKNIDYVAKSISEVVKQSAKDGKDGKDGKSDKDTKEKGTC